MVDDKYASAAIEIRESGKTMRARWDAREHHRGGDQQRLKVRSAAHYV
jgi:hypothetical protein